jgi:hypothetical protein
LCGFNAIQNFVFINRYQLPIPETLMTKPAMSAYAMQKEIRRAHEQHENDRNKWAFYIGHTVLIFSAIEHLALLFIERAVPMLRDFTASFLLDKRLDLLLHILPEYEHMDQVLKTQLISSLKQAKKLANKRNLIVHNPVLLTFTPDSATGKLSGEGRISSARNKNVDMNLAGMIEFVDEAESCRAEINDLFSRTAHRMLMGAVVKPKRKRTPAKVVLDKANE